VIETAARSDGVIAVANELLEKLVEMLLIEWNDLVGKLPAWYSDKPLGEWILHRLLASRPYGLNSVAMRNC